MVPPFITTSWCRSGTRAKFRTWNGGQTTHSMKSVGRKSLPHLSTRLCA